MAKPLITELTIPALPDFVGIVRFMISGLLTRMNFTAEEVEDIKVALSEACTNAIQYAYPKKRENNTVNIKIVQQKKSLEITVKDSGVGFDIKNPPKRKLHDKDIHMGLGLVFINNLMDEVKITSHKNKGTVIKMVKKIKA